MTPFGAKWSCFTHKNVDFFGRDVDQGNPDFLLLKDVLLNKFRVENVVTLIRITFLQIFLFHCTVSGCMGMSLRPMFRKNYCNVCQFLVAKVISSFLSLIHI